MIDAGGEHPHVMDPAGESYLRQEGRGLCIGFYEQPCRPWAVNGTPWDFGHELLADDFDKIEDSIAFAYKRFPALESAGVKSVIHGPFTFAPDGNPLVGPVPGMRNYWSACAVMAGFSQGGGVGLTLAQWMVEGEPERDVFAMDCARFGAWITPGYTVPKVIENYQKRRFSVSLIPNEELPAARRLAPYDSDVRPFLLQMGAVWGAAIWARGRQITSPKRAMSRRLKPPLSAAPDAWHAATAREVTAVRSGVGINEVQNFRKIPWSPAPQARAWLDRIMAGRRMPQPGRSVAHARCCRQKAGSSAISPSPASAEGLSSSSPPPTAARPITIAGSISQSGSPASLLAEHLRSAHRLSDRRTYKRRMVLQSLHRGPMSRTSNSSTCVIELMGQARQPALCSSVSYTGDHGL